FIVYNEGIEGTLQLSFLIEGEKIISVKEMDKDILYENQECYLADISSFNGYNRIWGGKILKEFKIRVTKSFLAKHGFPENYNFKKLSDKGLIVPITDDLLSILNSLEEKSFKGLVRKIYIEAKILELLATQIENYRKYEFNEIKINKNDKTIKKLYTVKKLLKDNLYRSFSLKQLAREVVLNENVLKCEFKRVFGC